MNIRLFRLLAFLLTVGGVLAAIFCPTQILSVITVIVMGIIMFVLGYRDATKGTSAETGISFLFVRGGLYILVPMWIAWLIANHVH